MYRPLVVALLLVSLGLAGTPPAWAQDKPLTHEAYDRWEEIEERALSDDGQWALYVTRPPKGDSELQVKHLESEQHYTVARGEQAQFTGGSQFAAFLIDPPYDSTRQAQLDDVPPPKRPKDDLGLLDLSSGEVTKIDSVQSYKLPEDGRGWMAYHREPPRPDSAESDDDSEGEDDEAEGAPLVIRHLESGQEWRYEDVTDYAFSEDGTRVFFGTAPTPPPPVEKDSLLEEEQVEVDVWNWKDPYIQPMQKERAEEKKKQTYRAVYFTEADRLMQIATEEVPAVTVGDEGNADVALGVTNRPYRQELSWDWPPTYDAYLIDLQRREREKILENVQDIPQLSPAGEYVTWWDRNARDWKALGTDDQSRVTLSQGIPHSVHDHRHDRPYPPGPYGLAGWTEGDEQVLIYDRHDIWTVDPTQSNATRSLTEEVGRDHDLRFRHVKLDREREPAAWGDWPNPANPPTVVPDGPLLLSAFNVETKADGFYRDQVGGSNRPTELLMMERSFSQPQKADDANRLLYTRESFQEFPDLWVADRSFSSPTKISTVNPQQSEYRWGTAELVEWTSANGEKIEGILYKPEDFDPDSGREYPMMTYFYEQYSDDLYEHYAPEAHRSIINFTFYVSRGYLVFVPNIHYERGYPGESAMQSVMPGVTRLADEDYVDEDNIGVQGHSWGGYQIAYMVTKTDLFAVAEAGAPVSNMISSYGGIRWGSGMSRMFQYEDTQSRIGSSLWDMPMRYIYNSPIFWADRIETPLMMMHNDHDSAVPWEQGIELFVALRRLNKPAWLINYTGEVHWPTDLAEMRDWTKRMQQFFDHYLKGAPAPVWLKEGVPATKKGRTLGLEPATTDPER